MAITGTEINRRNGMDRYRAAYRALHGRAVTVTWTGEKFRVHTPGENPAYDIRFDAAELDAVSTRMEAKVAETAAAREAAANAPDDIFGAFEAELAAEANTPERLAEDAAAAERRAARNAGVDIFDVPETDEEPDEDSDDEETDEGGAF